MKYMIKNNQELFATTPTPTDHTPTPCAVIKLYSDGKRNPPHIDIKIVDGTEAMMVV